MWEAELHECLPQGLFPGLDLDRRVTLAGTPVESLDGLHRPAWGVEGGGLRWGNCRDAVGIHQRRRRWRIGASPAATKRGSSREKMVGDELEFCLVKLASHWGSCGNQGISGSNGRAAASPVGCASCFLPGEESGYRCYCGQKLGIAFSVTIDWSMWVSRQGWGLDRESRAVLLEPWAVGCTDDGVQIGGLKLATELFIL